MRSIRLASLLPMAIALTAVSHVQAAPASGPCRQIVDACQQAGFTRGDARSGAGLQAHCVTPGSDTVSLETCSGACIASGEAGLLAGVDDLSTGPRRRSRLNMRYCREGNCHRQKTGEPD